MHCSETKVNNCACDFVFREVMREWAESSIPLYCGFHWIIAVLSSSVQHWHHPHPTVQKGQVGKLSLYAQIEYLELNVTLEKLFKNSKLRMK
jgi:hypothetical protein